MKTLKFLAISFALSLLSVSPLVSAPARPSISKSPASSPSPTASQSPPIFAQSPGPTPDNLRSSPSPDHELQHPSGDVYKPALRAKALELAGAFSNDGYKIRDSFWFSVIPPIGQTAVLAVNLFAGNQYWFCLAVAPSARRLILNLYNESGILVSTQSYEKDSMIALGAEPIESGKYYLTVKLLEGTPDNFCVLYTYK